MPRVLASNLDRGAAAPRFRPEDEDFIVRAINGELPLEFRYTDSEGQTLIRSVSPYELRETAQGDRLVAWDHLRDGIRQFAPERIKYLTAAVGIEFRQAEVEQ